MSSKLGSARYVHRPRNKLSAFESAFRGDNSGRCIGTRCFETEKGVPRVTISLHPGKPPDPCRLPVMK